MLPEDQPTILTPPPDGSRPAPVGWQAPTAEELQAKLPQYDVLEVLGRGGMGAVYKARQKSLKRLVAIKILPLGMVDDEFKFTERFQNEAQTMAQMNHPAIVSVYDFGETADGLLYFVMEFVDGTDVHKMIQASGKLSGEYALAITAHVCDALSYAHKRGVIHRDIKPANILIDQEGHIKVADFGLAKMDDPAQTSGLTKTGTAMGTPDYVAPEVLSPGMVADHRADIYAVGVMLYQMLTGEVPRGMFKLPSQKGIGSDPRFDEIICKAMEQDREERYQSAMDVRRDLDVILTTPQPKKDGTGIVPVEELPPKPVAKQPRPPGQANAPAQNKPPAKGAAKQAPAQKAAAAQKAKAPPKKQSPAAMWMSIGGIVAVLGVAGFVAFGGKTKLPVDQTGIAGANASPASPQQQEIAVRENPSSMRVDAPTAVAPNANGKPGTGVIDWINSPPSTMTGWSPEWNLKDGMLTPSTQRAMQFGVMKDGVVRIRVRLRPDYMPENEGSQLQLTIRSGSLAGAPGRTGHLQFQTYVPNRTASIDFQEKTTPGLPVERLLDGKPRKASELASREVEWEFRAEGDEYTARVDGELVASVRDARVASGYCALEVRPGIQIMRLETTGLTPTKAGPTKVRVETGQVIDWLKTVPPGASPWGAAWGLKDGVLTPTSVQERLLQLRREFGVMTDGSVRVRVRRAPGADPSKRPMLTVEIRRGPVAIGATNNGQYQFQVFVPDRSCTLNYEDIAQRKIEYLWARDASARTDNDEIEWEFRVVGDEFSAWADGKLIHSARDARVPSGICTMVGDPGLQITRLETTGLKPTKPSSQPASGQTDNKSTAAPVITDWKEVTESVREKVRTMEGCTVTDGVIRWNGSSKWPPNVPITAPGAADYAIRVGYTHAAQINVRSGATGFVYVRMGDGGLTISRWMRGGKAPVSLLGPQPLPSDYKKGDLHNLTVAVQGTTIRAWIDGELAATTNEATLSDGTGDVMLTTDSEVRKVEVAELTAASSAPPSANWQDLTAKLRENVAKKAGFTVDAVGVTRAPNAPIGDTMVMGPSEKDRAVRVGYTGQAQVSLWFKSGAASAFVLAARDRMMFKHQKQRVGESDTMLPSVTHLAGYDPTQPHELTVAVQGSVVRAWLDGRHVGDAENAELKECSIAVVPMSSSTVRKVEVAELSTASSSAQSAEAQWQPIFNQPADFGGDMRDDVEFRDGATFIKARTFLAPADPAIVGIRSTMRYLTGGDPTGSLTLRSTEGAKYGEEDFALTAYIAPKGTSLVVKMRDRPAGISELGRHDFPLSPALKEGDLFTFELRAENKKIVVSINGREVGTLDDAWTGATRRFGITPSIKEMTEFRDVAVRADSPR